MIDTVHIIGLVILGVTIITGWKKGFVKILGSICASILGFGLIYCIKTWAFDSVFINFLTGQSVLGVRLLLCVGLYLILVVILKLVIKSLGFLTKLPIIKGVNRVLGLVAGAVYGLILIGILNLIYSWIA